ncbi:hypothetical protein AGLY_017937, partial [Aphis glycines]
ILNEMMNVLLFYNYVFFVVVSVYSITCRNNASISNFRGGFRLLSEYPWCIIEVKSKHFPTVFKKIDFFMVQLKILAAQKKKIKNVIQGYSRINLKHSPVVFCTRFNFGVFRSLKHKLLFSPPNLKYVSYFDKSSLITIVNHAAPNALQSGTHLTRLFLLMKTIIFFSEAQLYEQPHAFHFLYFSRTLYLIKFISLTFDRYFTFK